jgi:glycosyltransferase involved in cell wall biosynthesis
MLAFADSFKEMGHDVTVVTNWLTERDEFDPDNFLEWDLCEHLTPDNFVFINNMGRHLQPGNLPPEMRVADLILVSYGEMGHVQQMVRCPVVAWVINPLQGRPDCLRHVWTNSETTRQRLLDVQRWKGSDPKVIIPPHSYTEFRLAAKPYPGRRFDVITVGTLIPDKGLIEAAQLAEDMKLSIVVVGRVQPHNMSGSRRIAECLQRGKIIYVQDAPRQQVASLMGKSLVYLSMSRDESCSLAIYEAMSAGCHIVGRNVGAIQEQLGGTGCIFETAMDARLGVKAMMSLGEANKAGMKRAMKFDRGSVQPRLKEVLNALG